MRKDNNNGFGKRLLYSPFLVTFSVILHQRIYVFISLFHEIIFFCSLEITRLIAFRECHMVDSDEKGHPTEVSFL